jgi:hypothetical protein
MTCTLMGTIFAKVLCHLEIEPSPFLVSRCQK